MGPLFVISCERRRRLHSPRRMLRVCRPRWPRTIARGRAFSRQMRFATCDSPLKLRTSRTATISASDLRRPTPRSSKRQSRVRTARSFSKLAVKFCATRSRANGVKTRSPSATDVSSRPRPGGAGTQAGLRVRAAVGELPYGLPAPDNGTGTGRQFPCRQPSKADVGFEPLAPRKQAQHPRRPRPMAVSYQIRDLPDLRYADAGRGTPAVSLNALSIQRCERV